MKSILDIAEGLVQDIPADGREYTVFMSHDYEQQEYYIEVTNEFDEIIADMSFNSDARLINNNGLFGNKWDWETKYKVVKPLTQYTLNDSSVVQVSLTGTWVSETIDI